MLKILIYKNIAWLIFDKILRLLGGIIVTIWVARYLGPKNFGTLNYAIAYTAFFSLFVNMGLEKIIVREVVKNIENTNYLIGTAFFLKLFGACISLFILIFTVSFQETNIVVKYTIILIAISFVFQSLDVIDTYFQALLLSKYIVFARSISFILSSMVKIFLILNNYPVMYFALAFSIEILLSAIFLSILYKRTKNNIFKWRYNTTIAINFLRDSWPLAIMAFLAPLYMRIDQAMIKSMLDLEHVGIYSVAVKLSEYFYFIPAIIVKVFLPYFVKLRQINMWLYEKRLMQIYSAMFWFGLLIGIIIIIFGEDLIKLLFGEHYIGAYKALVFNIWSGIFMAQALVRGIWVINENVQFYSLILTFSAIVINITLNLYLIRSMGISGAAIASLISISFSTWVLSIFIAPLRKSTYAMLKSISPTYLFGKY